LQILACLFDSLTLAPRWGNLLARDGKCIRPLTSDPTVHFLCIVSIRLTSAFVRLTPQFLVSGEDLRMGFDFHRTERLPISPRHHWQCNPRLLIRPRLYAMPSESREPQFFRYFRRDGLSYLLFHFALPVLAGKPFAPHSLRRHERASNEIHNVDTSHDVHNYFSEIVILPRENSFKTRKRWRDFARQRHPGWRHKGEIATCQHGLSDCQGMSIS
jgi:hypothetical protein